MNYYTKIYLEFSAGNTVLVVLGFLFLGAPLIKLIFNIEFDETVWAYVVGVFAFICVYCTLWFFNGAKRNEYRQRSR